MYKWSLVATFAVTACDFQASVGPNEAASGPDAAAQPDGGTTRTTGDVLDDVLNVGPQDEYTGIDDLTIAAPITIDTGAMSFGMPLPPGATFAARPQGDGGPELAILHVHRLDVHATVHVTGPRPLVVIADSIELTETIDVTAPRDRAASTSPISCSAAASSSRAIELYARTRILISGYITVGDGAGFADGACQASFLGGAGGTIVLQAPSIENSGRLSADGGGGAGAGGGSSGQIVFLYKTRVAAGVTSPTAITKLY